MTELAGLAGLADMADMAELEGYHFDLPARLIARYPTDRRSDSRLMVVNIFPQLTIQDCRFFELTRFLRPTDILMLNSSAVSRRRVYLQRKSGARLEALFLAPLADGSWSCLVKGRRKLRHRERLMPLRLTPPPASASNLSASNLSASNLSAGNLRDRNLREHKVEFLFMAGESDQESQGDNSRRGNSRLQAVIAASESPAWRNAKDAEDWFAQNGMMPIPPYLARQAEELDNERYQTIYAESAGSIAAPTAGLHFSPALLDRVGRQGTRIEKLELKIGYSTFAPLAPENFLRNRLHRESYRIEPETADLLNRRQRQGRIIATGTTTLRALESNFRAGKGRFQGGSFTTELFLKPPDYPRSIQGLLTNFHLPASSLLLLVASLLGKERLLSLYQYAIHRQYRFYSYGDAMLILL